MSAVDISPFINNLPFGRATTAFTTADASGSTSMAANIQEVHGSFYPPTPPIDAFLLGAYAYACIHARARARAYARGGIVCVIQSDN